MVDYEFELLADVHFNYFLLFYVFHRSVPEAPAAIKALKSGSQTVMVSWLPPSQPNGVISKYTVYYREIYGSIPKKEDVSQHELSFEVFGLNSNTPYEFWVSASADWGEGKTTESVSATPNDQVPAGIITFNDTYTAMLKTELKLPCLAVGLPKPRITWQVCVQFT